MLLLRPGKITFNDLMKALKIAGIPALERCNESKIDMTEARKPSELFGLRWRSLDDQNALPLTETVLAANARPFGKTPSSLTKSLMAWRTNELWKMLEAC
jgi:hypothetical protein